MTDFPEDTPAKAPLKKGPKSPEEKARRVKLLAEWHATPEELRLSKSLTALAVDNGCIPNSSWFKLAHSDRVYHETMLIIAGSALGRAPAILKKLADDALSDNRNSTRAAEVYLEWSRKIITDSSLLERVAPNPDTVGSLIDKLDTAIDVLTDKAHSHLKAVEPAQWKDLPDETLAPNPDPDAAPAPPDRAPARS